MQGSQNGTPVNFEIKLNSDRTLELWNVSAQIGSDSSSLDLDTWYRIEVKAKHIGVGTGTLELLLDGNVVATSSAETLASTMSLFQFGILTSTTADLFWDDIAINNATGSFQNTYPGAGSLIYLKPDSAGDVNAWETQVGGTADTANNYTRVQEENPDGATTYNGSNTLNNEDLYNLEATPVAIASGDTINCVMIGLHWAGAGTSANASLKLEIESSASGTIEQSTQITRTATGYATNAIANGGVVNYRLILYDLPGASTTAWTKADIDTAQIGMKLTATSTNEIRVSTIWLIVDYTPTAGGSTGPANLKSLNTNIKSNIKSINTNLIANCKSLNTNT